MLDLWNIGGSVLWILGLVMLLATWSYAYYEAKLANRPIRVVLAGSGYDLAVNLGIVLVCTGLAVADARWWARLIWIILGVLAIVSYISRSRSSSRE